MLRHVVLLDFDESTTESTINEIFAGFGALAAKLPGVLAVTCGPNVSPEGLDRGYLHGFVMDFESGQARDDYLEHPEHVAFAEGTVIPALKNGRDSIIVFDYDVTDA
jgi:hypothetical protein